MNYKHISILIVLGMIIVGLGWDGYVTAKHLHAATWCQAVRDLNKASDGLLGLCLVALLIHILCLQWFPTAWVHG